MLDEWIGSFGSELQTMLGVVTGDARLRQNMSEAWMKIESNSDKLASLRDIRDEVFVIKK